MNYTPSYIKLYESGELMRRADSLRKILERCTLCPHNCKVNRLAGQTGKCNSGPLPVVSSYSPHFGEERPLVGRNGSGTIFFTNCNLACIFCQNYDISHLGRGAEISYQELADIMLALQSRGCHNINFVSPTHMASAIVESLLVAVPMGLELPLVYNSGGYDSVEALTLLDGIIDIYMPDFKYMDSAAAKKLSGAEDYPQAAEKALYEMHRQTGDLEIDKSSIAYRGLLVRHLVLPNNLARTDRVIDVIARMSLNTYINIMDQYRPEYRARECFDLKRRITLHEYNSAVDHAKKRGLRRIDGILS